jgi:hypothetical protein
MTQTPFFWLRAGSKPAYRRVKRPPLPDGRATPTGQGHFWKWGVRRKHEAEPMYVANSESRFYRDSGEEIEQAWESEV